MQSSLPFCLESTSFVVCVAAVELSIFNCVIESPAAFASLCVTATVVVVDSVDFTTTVVLLLLLLLMPAVIIVVVVVAVVVVAFASAFTSESELIFVFSKIFIYEYEGKIYNSYH